MVVCQDLSRISLTYELANERQAASRGKRWFVLRFVQRNDTAKQIEAKRGSEMIWKGGGAVKCLSLQNG